MLLNKDQILGCIDLPSELVEVPEWQGSVKVRGLTADERDSVESEISEHGIKKFRARLCAMCIVDEEGNNVFSESEIDMLGRKSGVVLDRIAQVVTRLSGMTQEDVDQLEKT